MHIKDFQKEVNEIILKKQSGEVIFLHIVEEIGEIAKQFTNKHLGRENFDLKNLEEEISDSIILLVYLASVYNIDLEDSLLRDLKKIKKYSTKGKGP